jgi:hypothetical protein
VDGDVGTLFASHVCRSRLHVSSSQFHSKVHSACQTTSANIAARFFGIAVVSKEIMTHFVRTRIVRWDIPSLLLLSHFSARNSVCVPGRQCFTMPSFCFDMIMQKHPVVFANLLNSAKSNVLKNDSDSTGYKHDDPRLPAMFATTRRL